jgi:hypothetical protein
MKGAGSKRNRVGKPQGLVLWKGAGWRRLLHGNGGWGALGIAVAIMLPLERGESSIARLLGRAGQQ